MSQPFVGPLIAPELPPQPTFAAYCTNWDAFDVPRLWDVVRPEDDELGWEQVTGFRHLSDLLIEHYRRLRSQHDKISQSWQSPAAEVVLQRIDACSQAILSDGHCAASTAKALDAIMSAYAQARMQMVPLIGEWNNVTSDWKPEWWDHAADKLNNEARDIMVKTDAAVGDHRTKIIVPDSTAYGVVGSPPPTTPGDETSSSSGGGPAGSRVPSTPGYRPVSNAERGADLASMPAPVPAVPGQPVSMLPIPPGSIHAPYGGAYILPGRGVGPGGYVVPMPHPSNGNGSRASNLPRYGGYGQNSGGGQGMMPVAFGTPATNNNSVDRGSRRSANTIWLMHKGVPPVIEGIENDVVIPDQPSEKQAEDFKEWFAELAYPWRSEQGSGKEPQIVLRKVSE